MEKIGNEYASSEHGDTVNDEVFDRGRLVGVDLWLYHYLKIQTRSTRRLFW